MSCQLVRLASISDLNIVKSTLFPNAEEAEENKKTYHEAWDWPVESFEPEPDKKAAKEENRWLQECITALSPTADVLAFGRRWSAVFLTAKHGVTSRSDWKYEISFCGQLKSPNGGDITAMLCLPLSSQKRSYQGAPDWTCVIVGFRSGHIQIYTDDGKMLLTQLLHEEPVLQLKCQTYTPPRFGGFNEQPDELSVVYPRAVVCVEGFGLFQTLRACRNQLARTSAGNQASVIPPPLSYKKWGPQDVRNVRDCEIAGTVLPSLFDQMVTESIRKANGGKVRYSAASSSLLLATGSDPYLAFYYAREGSIQPLLSDVAVAVASRLKSFLAENNAEALGAATNPKLSLVKRYPNGYRDADCGWVEVEDSSPDTRVNGVPRKTQFLVVYAPRWGLVEIWCPHQTSRVASFEVGKGGRLVCNNYTLMGLNNVLVKTVKPNTYPCCYISAEGQLYAVAVPFHRVLSERNRARDWQLLNEVQGSLKDGDGVPDEDEEQLSYDAKLLWQTCRRLRQLCQLHKAVDRSHADDCTLPPLSDPTVEELAEELSVQPKKLSRIAEHVERCRPLWRRADRRVTFGDENPVSLSVFLDCFEVGDSHLAKDGDGESPLEVALKKDAACDQLGHFLFSWALASEGCHSHLLESLVKSGIAPSALLQCLMLEWLSGTRAIDSRRSWVLFGKLLKRLVDLAGEDAEFTASTSVSPWWQRLRAILAASTNVPAAYVGSAVCQSVAARFVRSAPVDQHVATEEPQEVTSWTGALGTMVMRFAPKKWRLPMLLDGGFEYLFCGRTRDNEQEASGSGDRDDPVVINDDGEEEEVGEGWEPLVMEFEHWDSLLRKLDSVLELACLLRHCNERTQMAPDVREVSLSSLLSGGQGIITELVAAWACDVGLTPDDLERLSKLKLPEEGSNHLVDDYQCVGCIIWKTFLQKRFEALVLLMEKMGKTPKDRVCRRDVEISDIHLERFVGFCSQILEAILEAAVGPEVETLPVLPQEPLWQGQEQTGPQPLVSHALGQRPPNMASVRHHLFLATVARTVVCFAMRSVRPLSLFTPSVRKAFFQDLHSPLVAPTATVSPSLKSSPQRSFLLRAASAVIQSIPDGAAPETLSWQFGWLERLLDLAWNWGEDLDVVRRHCVCELYSGGQDTFAEEVTPAVKNRAELGSQLLVIAGQRVHHLLFMNDANMASRVAELPPHVSNWLRAQDPKVLRLCNPPVSQTISLLDRAMNYLPEDSHDQEIAISLSEVVHKMASSQPNSLHNT
ncbi:hypothetical protein HPB47_027157 [Ixodes persulcatus]|uniref:Uncharacterized protein n=1 Tax=Ixodes persulcatus TaxID=34615 RepID=A0AC60PYP3_IXOPE|nr:hypothetical protein HPB47_027157 [Ixodes persulcatus]